MFPKKIFFFFTCVPFFFSIFDFCTLIFIILLFFLFFLLSILSFCKDCTVQWQTEERKENFFRRSIDGTTTQQTVIFQRPMTREVITVISPNPGRDMGFSVWKFSPPPDLLCQEVRGTRLINEEARKLRQFFQLFYSCISMI